MTTLDELFQGKNKATISGLEDIFAPPFDPRVAVPETEVKISNARPGAYGWVYRDEPSNIYLNPTMRAGKGAPHVLAHETEHVLANNVDKRYKANKSNWDQEFMKQSKLTENKLVDYLQKSAKNKMIPYYFENKYKFPIKYFGVLDDGQFSLREQMAELSAAEGTLKTDFSKDPFIMKNIFNNDKQFFDAYRATTGLRTNRLDAKDLPPMTVKTK